MARRADPSRLPRQDGAGGDAGVPPAVRVVAERCVRDRPRPADVRRPQADRARAAGRAADVLLVAVGADDRLQGDVHARPSSAQFYPDLTDPRIESALLLVHSAVLDQHVPVVAARPPVPLHRPQRRDQHGAGQPELDASPRGDGRQPRCCPISTRRFRSAPRAHPTPPASTRCSSCCTSPAARCTTPC